MYTTLYCGLCPAPTGTTLVSQEADLLTVECLQWRSPRMLCWQGSRLGLFWLGRVLCRVFWLSGPCLKPPGWRRVQRTKQKRGTGAELLIASHKAQFSHFHGNTDRWWSLSQQKPRCWASGPMLDVAGLLFSIVLELKVLSTQASALPTRLFHVLILNHSFNYCHIFWWLFLLHHHQMKITIRFMTEWLLTLVNNRSANLAC